MRSAKTLSALALSLLLIGAGCSSANTNTGLEDPNPSDDEITVNMDDFSAANDTNSATNTAMPDKTVEPSTTMDDSWKTYSNTALGFEFKWPSKGKYAPQWDMTALKEGDASVVDGCVGKADGVDSSTMKVGDNTFCHTSANSKPAVDKYTTKVGTSWVVLTFKKDGADDFDWKAYRENLDQIVSTFKKTK